MGKTIDEKELEIQEINKLKVQLDLANNEIQKIKKDMELLKRAININNKDIKDADLKDLEDNKSGLEFVIEDEKKEDGIKDDDIGVENATPEVIIEALNRAKITLEEKVETFDAQDMFYFGLNGDPNAKARRIKLGNKLGIGYGNANQMLSRLNNYGITKEEFIEAIKFVDKELEKEK